VRAAATDGSASSAARDHRLQNLGMPVAHRRRPLGELRQNPDIRFPSTDGDSRRGLVLILDYSSVDWRDGARDMGSVTVRALSRPRRNRSLWWRLGLGATALFLVASRGFNVLTVIRARSRRYTNARAALVPHYDEVAAFN